MINELEPYEPISVYSWEEFHNLNDKDLQKFIRMKGLVNSGQGETRRSEDDEKISYYHIVNKLSMNLQGAFYKKSELSEWISYSKKTKKVKVSKNQGNIMELFINDHFKCSEIILPFINRLTSTLCKKIIEGKIFDLEGILKYHRSYTVRRKELDLIVLGKFLIRGEQRVLQVLKDPENLENFQDLFSIPDDFRFSLPFQFTVEQIPKINKMYEQWDKEQNKKLIGLQGSRNAKASDYPSLISTF